MKEERDPLLGAVIHGFRVEEKLGEGGMGKVFVARHESLSIRKVVKVLLPEYSRDPHIRARFLREAEAVACMDHPHVITVDNFGELPSGELFLTMPLLTGKPLDKYLQAAVKLGAHHALQIAAQLGSALQHAHGRGIIHRDLKPGNIFIERKRGQDVVKLLDFGIAKDTSVNVANARTRTGMAIGTPSYMACEQYDDAGTVTSAADVFALAVVVVEMLTGQLPWGVHDQGVLYFQQKTVAPTFGPEVPRAWIPVLTAALSPEPARRPQSARAFIVALASSLDALPPLWSSGAEILRDFAPDLIKGAAFEDATVRARESAPLPNLTETIDHRSSRPRVTASPTTLSASNGAAFRRSQAPKPRLLTLAVLLVVTAAGIGALVAFVSGAAHAHHETPSTEPSHVLTPDAALAAPHEMIVPAVAPVDAGAVDASAADASVPVVRPTLHNTAAHRTVDAGVQDAYVAPIDAPRASSIRLEVQPNRGDLVASTDSCGNDAEMSLERLVHSPARISIEGSTMTLAIGSKHWTADRSTVTASHAAGFFDQGNDTVIAVSVQYDDDTEMMEITRFVRGDGQATKCSDKWRGQARRLGL